MILVFLYSLRYQWSSFHLSISTKYLCFHSGQSNTLQQTGGFWVRASLQTRIILAFQPFIACCYLVGTIPASQQLHRAGTEPNCSSYQQWPCSGIFSKFSHTQKIFNYWLRQLPFYYPIAAIIYLYLCVHIPK